jgi:hypothetical protein
MLKIHTLVVIRLLAAVLPAPALGAIVPWAPLLAGVTSLESYVSQLLSLPSLLALSTSTLSLSSDSAAAAADQPPVRPHVRAFRCSLQNKPKGAWLAPDFIASLKWLGERGFAFEFVLDSYSHSRRARGPDVVEEVLQCIEKVREGQDEQKRTRFIIGQ